MSQLPCSFNKTTQDPEECYQHNFGTLKEQTGKVVDVVMRTALNGDEAGRLRLLQEAATLSQFDHPNIIKLLGISCTKDEVNNT